MKMKLTFPDAIDIHFDRSTYDSDLDDVRSILIDLCHCAGRFGELYVSGFGQDAWPVTAETDLPVLLEQIPTLLQAVTLRETGTLDFFEQGVQRVVTFDPNEDAYSASCASYGDWVPNPDTEQIGGDELRAQLEGVRDEFVRMVRLIAPHLIRHPCFQSWLRGEPERSF